MHLTIKERVELVLMSGADGATNRSVAKKFNRIYLAKKFCFNKNVCYYYLNCFICFGALFMAQNVCYYYLNCFICFGALFMAHPVHGQACRCDGIVVRASALQSVNVGYRLPNRFIPKN